MLKKEEEEENQQHNTTSMNTTTKSIIKSIVLSGGGPLGLIMYGILRESNKDGLWNIQELETIYGTSIGSICAVIIALNYEWDILNEYIINRPWHHVFKWNMYSLINAIPQKGIFDKQIIIELFKPLFYGKDISMDITMIDFYKKTNIELHFYTTEINCVTTREVDISYITHPEWKIIDAVYASSCLPILFSPLQTENEYFIDGGIYNNYPIQESYQKYKHMNESIFGIKTELHSPSFDDSTTFIKQFNEFNIFDFLLFVITKMWPKMKSKLIDNEITIKNTGNFLVTLHNVISSKDERLLLINQGVLLWKTNIDIMKL